MTPEPGTLYIVATPIGNLGDISPRAQATLGAVDAICAEDTRTTGQLLAHLGLHKPLIALHAHNEAAQSAQLLTRLQGGASLALVSDAGTPLISDPGYPLLRAVRAAGLAVIAIPGPSAVITALCMAGLPTDEFLFAGFLPAKAKAREQRLASLAAEPRTVVFYESPHRIADTAQALAACLAPERLVFVARELTKKFEESALLRADALVPWFDGHAHRQTGEFVLAFAPPDAPATDGIPEEAQRLLKRLMDEISPSRAAKVVSEHFGVKRQGLYELALQWSGKTDPRLDA